MDFGRACIVARVPPRTVAALLERERELAICSEGFVRARAGEGALILIEGPAGVGKTELSREARAAAGHAGLMPLEARGSELEQPFAFGVVRQLLEPVIAAGPDPFAGAAGPAARLFERDERQAWAADAGGFEALHSLYWLVVNLADRAPLLVLVDDCHWVDHDSLRFLSYLAQRIEGLPVAMLLAGRPPADEPGSVWGQVASRAAAVVLYPRPLSQSAAVALTRERLGADAEDTFCRACHTATGGNPLFLRELLTALEAAGIEPSAAAAGDIQAVGPAAVRRFVLHRLATLGAPANELARAVAVLGDDTELQLAGQVSGLDEDAAAAAADDLVRADIFVRQTRLGFVHPIVRAALYEDLAPGERQARHAAAAEALTATGASPERVTAHLLLTGATGDPGRVEALRAAATAAARRGAPGAAAERLRRALAESPAEQQRGEILAELGRYEVYAMQFEAAEEHLRAALASGADLTTRAGAASMLGRCAIVSGGRSAEAAVDALASLGEELRPLDPERSLELKSELLIVTTGVVPLRARRSEHLQPFAEQARGHPGFEAVARIHEAQERLAAGGSAVTAAEEVQAALATGLPPSAAGGAGFLALITLRLGERHDLAMRLLDVALESARREGHAARQGVVHGQRAAIAIAHGSLGDALTEAETGLAAIGEHHVALPQLAAVAIDAHMERGEIEAAELAARAEALGIAEDRPFSAPFLVSRGRLRVAQGETYAGLEDLLRCGARLHAHGIAVHGDWRPFAAQALAAVGESERAAALAHEQIELARGLGASGTLGRALRTAGTAIGGDEGLAHLEEAVKVLHHSPARLEHAHALADLGAELGRRRRRRESREVLRLGVQEATSCGADALAERVRGELGAGGGRPARLQVTGVDALTPAERRVCVLAAAGDLTNRDIAQRLFVTEKTVERHLTSAYRKLGIRSRFQLAEAIDDRVGVPQKP